LTIILFPPGSSGRQTCTKVGKRQLYTKRRSNAQQIPKHRILKVEKYVPNKKANVRRISGHTSKL